MNFLRSIAAKLLLTALVCFACVSPAHAGAGFTSSRSKPGLVVTINGGTAVISNTVTALPVTDVSLSANVTTYVYLNLTSGAIETSTSGFLAGSYPICIAITNRTDVSSLTDSRPDVFGAAASVTTGTTLPTSGCTVGQLFNQTQVGSNTSLLWRNLTNSGTACNFQQIKPTVETIYAKDYGVQATGGVITDMTTVNASPNVACPNSDCNFTSANVGMLFFASNLSGTSAATQVCPAVGTTTTILTVTDANHIVLAANCTANQTANATGVWGPDDTATSTAAWTAATQICNTLQLPSGVIIVKTPQWNTQGPFCANSQTWDVPGVFGASPTATVIIPAPDFNFTNCTGGSITACFFGVNFQLVQNLKIWGIGLSPAGCGSNTLSEVNQGLDFDVVYANWCQNGAGSFGTKVIGQQAEALFGGTVGFGQTTVQLNGNEASIQQWPAYGSNLGISVVGVGPQFSIGNFFGGTTFDISVGAGAVFNSYSDQGFSASGGNITVSGRFNANSYKRVSSSSLSTVLVNNGGSLYTQNSIWLPSTSGNQNGLWAVVNPNATIHDQDGNTYGGGTAATQLPQVAQTPNSCSPAAGGTAACAYGANVTAGNLELLTVIITTTANTISGCSGTSSGAWTQQGTSQDTPSVNHAAVRTAVFFKANAPGGADTVTCTFSGSSTANIILMEYQGAATASPVDVVQVATGSGAAVSTTSPVTTLASDLVILTGASNFGATLTAGTGYAIVGTLSGTAGAFAESRADTYSAATYAATGTLSPTTIDWAVWALGIKSANPTAGAGVYVNQEQSGVCTFASTTCTVTFPTPFQASPACTAGDQSAAAPVRAAPPTKTQVVLTGGAGAGATDVAAWNCK